jgi:dihydrofolate reductase
MSDSEQIPVFKMIVALCRGGGIGFEGTLPWPKIERDLRFFSHMTRSDVFPYNSAVVMGRKTWESIPADYQPLPFRDNIVVSATHDFDTEEHKPGVIFVKTLSDVHKFAMNYDVVWFIGGASIYEQVLTPCSTTGSGSGGSGGGILFPIEDIYVTFVDETYEHDAAFPLTYQYDSVEQWQSLRHREIHHRAIWCWTDEKSMPSFVSFFAEGPVSKHLYCVKHVDEEIISKITRPVDILAIKERRSPNTVFYVLQRVVEV